MSSVASLGLGSLSAVPFVLSTLCFGVPVPGCQSLLISSSTPGSAKTTRREQAGPSHVHRSRPIPSHLTHYTTIHHILTIYEFCRTPVSLHSLSVHRLRRNLRLSHLLCSLSSLAHLYSTKRPNSSFLVAILAPSPITTLSLRMTVSSR